MSRPNSVLTHPALLLLIGVFSIAWSAIFVRWTHTPGAVSAFYRVLIADVMLLPLLAVSPRPWLPASTKEWLACAAGGVFFAGDLALYNTAALRNSAGIVSLLGNSAPLFVGLLSWIVFRRRPSLRFWLGLGVAFCGSATILFADRRDLLGSGLADAMALASAFCFALYLVATERLRSTWSTVPLLALSLAVSTTALGAFCLIRGLSFRVPSPSAWLAMLGLGGVCQLLGYLALTRSLGRLPATTASVSLLAQAPLTALLALGFFHERLRSAQMAGGFVVLSGVWIVTSRPASRTVLLSKLIESKDK